MPPELAIEFKYRGSGHRDERADKAGPRMPDPSRPLEKRAVKLNEASAKRIVDVAIALGAILTLVPIFLTVAALIKAESSGPVFFRQRRYGAGRKSFLIFKFRTMTVMEADGSFRQAVAGDNRVTQVGRFLRRSSLDEMPQLINVLLGDMSLVGPRPHAIAMDDTFAESVPDYDDRFLVRPGLTGLAQINGCRGPTETHDKITRRLSYDRVYIRRWSLPLDLAIIARTPIALVRDPNAL